MRTYRILMVEDNPADVVIVREILKDSATSYEISVVDSGENALPFLRKQGNYSSANRPDLVLLDINLPKKSGHEILGEIKRDSDLKAIPVVMFSSSSSPRDVQEAYGQHANSYIRKPQNLDGFVEVLRVLEHFWFNTASLPSVRAI
jgi:two-component system, chemotaxis family, response regulator Rcp1